MERRKVVVLDVLCASCAAFEEVDKLVLLLASHKYLLQVPSNDIYVAISSGDVALATEWFVSRQISPANLIDCSHNSTLTLATALSLNRNNNNSSNEDGFILVVDVERIKADAIDFSSWLEHLARSQFSKESICSPTTGPATAILIQYTTQVISSLSSSTPESSTLSTVQRVLPLISSSDETARFNPSKISSDLPPTSPSTSSLLRTIQKRCFARVGLMGNPSDGFGGKTVSMLISNFSATVTIQEIADSPQQQHNKQSISIQPHPHHDQMTFDDLNNLYFHSQVGGYYGGVRLLQATCKMFAQRCSTNSLKAFTWRQVQQHAIVISYETDIPRMVGLSGSSALVVATMRALMEYYDVTLQDMGLTEHELPQIVLDVEKVELGISAGLQDRVIQCLEGLVHMDFSNMVTNNNNSNNNNHSGVPIGIYTSLDPSLLPPLYLAYNTIAGGESGKVHSTVKERWANQDPVLVDGMNRLGKLADAAKDCLLTRQPEKLAALMSDNFQLRLAMYGKEVVGSLNLQAVSLANACGLGAKFSGSGGALICVRQTSPPSWFSEEEEGIIREKFHRIHFNFVRVTLPTL